MEGPAGSRLGAHPLSLRSAWAWAQGIRARCPGDTPPAPAHLGGRSQHPALTSTFKARCSAAAEGGAGRLPPRLHPCPWSLRTVRGERSQAEREDPAPLGPGDAGLTEVPTSEWQRRGGFRCRGPGGPGIRPWTVSEGPKGGHRPTLGSRYWC